MFRKLFSPKSDDLASLNRGRVCVPCDCFEDCGGIRKVELHSETQDTGSEAWRTLDSLIDSAVRKGAADFSPGLLMPPELWRQIVILPPTISRLTSVKRLYLYGSNLTRIPPEIGEMKALEELDIYTSYRLHWLPYEITRCRKLKRSRASTRALYGNYKFRNQFPRLDRDAPTSCGIPSSCSVCGGPFSSTSVEQVWISINVATDVFPLLVNACSSECINRLPPAAEGYVNQPHCGGPKVRQPPESFLPPGIAT